MGTQTQTSKFNLNDRAQLGNNKENGTIRGVMMHNAYHPEEIIFEILFVYDDEKLGREWISENSLSLIKK